MKGINRRQHEALKQSLQQLEALLSTQICSCKGQQNEISESENVNDLHLKQNILNIQNAQQAIEQSYLRYQQLLDQLSFHIAEYEDLYVEVKVNCLGNNLRQLLKDLPRESADFAMLKVNINIAKAV